MKVVHQIEYLGEPRLLSHAPQLARWPARFARAARAEWAIAASNMRVLRQLRDSHAPLKLDMGSGPRKGENGWTTIDRLEGCDLRLDLFYRTPFQDDEVVEIYSSHFLEYFAYRDILRILGEWRRILKPQGRQRLALPNARIFIEGYLRGRRFDADYYCAYKPALHSRAPIDIVNYIAYMDSHRHMFDEENLVMMLNASGFSDASLREFDPSIDMPEREFESIYAVARK